MTPELLIRLRKDLDAERESALEELRSLGADPHTGKVDTIEVDANFADSAAASAERAEILAFIEKARERLQAVEAAIAQMEEGRYGECAVCGGQIPEARLEARPLSVRCVDCASR
jgi:DnaK suppressor protein